MTVTPVSDAELANLIASLAGSTPEVIEVEPEPESTETQAIELLVSKLGAVPIEEAPPQVRGPLPVAREAVRDTLAATCGDCGTVMLGAAARYATCPSCALKSSGNDLFAPATPPATTTGATLTLVPGATPTRTAPVPAVSPPTDPLPVPGPTTKPANWDPPPSTVADMRDVLSDLDANRPRSQQVALGPSELGTACQRQVAMKLAGLPRQPDKRPPWAPMQGTAMHALMEEALRFHNGQLGRERWVIEERLHMDAEISGSGDAFDTDNAMVVDWKYTGSTALRKVKRKTVPVEQLVSPTYRVQAHLYGLGHQRAGRDVRWVRLVLLARSHDYDESAEWTERYQPDIALRALDRYYATQDLVNALDVANNPMLWPAVPAVASEDTCAWCPFRRVGGPADSTGCPGNTEDKINKQTAGLIP